MPLTLTHAGRAGPGASPPPPPPPLTSDLRAWYRFDNNRNDSSGAGRNLSGTGSYTTGKIGQAANNMSAAWFGTALDESSEFSISLWVKYNGDSGDNLPMLSASLMSDLGAVVTAAVDSRNGPVISQALFDISTGGSFGSAFAAGLTWAEWSHFVMTVDATDAKIYFNGSLVASNPVTLDWSGVQMNNITVTTNNDAVGIIDLCGFWTRALPAASVTALYNAGAGFDPTV